MLKEKLEIEMQGKTKDTDGVGKGRRHNLKT